MKNIKKLYEAAKATKVGLKLYNKHIDKLIHFLLLYI